MQGHWIIYVMNYNLKIKLDLDKLIHVPTPNGVLFLSKKAD